MQGKSEGTTRPIDRRIVSFNICGIKNVLNFWPWNEQKGLGGMFNYMKADVICFQELKIQARDLTKDMAIVPGYNSFFTFPTSKKGYSGVAVYVRDDIDVKSAEEGLTGYLQDLGTKKPYRSGETGIGGYPELSPGEALAIDSEGRALILDLNDCVVVCLYCPANSMGDREEYRDRFFEVLDERVRKLHEMGRRVIVTGDLNVAREPRDSAEGMQRFLKELRITRQEELTATDIYTWGTATTPRRVLTSWLARDSALLEDTTRNFFPDRSKMYTCWNQLLNARPANFGSRIDYVLKSPDIRASGADIWTDFMGSDHCPVYTDLILPGILPPVGKMPSLSRKRTIQFESRLRAMLTSSGEALTVQATEGGSPSSIGKPAANVSPPSEPSLRLSATTPMDSSLHGQKVQFARRQRDIASFFQVRRGLPASGLKKTSSPSPYERKKAADEHKLPEPDSLDKVGAKVASQVQSQQAWKKIFTLSKPLCYHKEECILQVAKKPGKNKGRSFWSCKRPQGEERDPESRCSFFKWA